MLLNIIIILGLVIATNSVQFKSNINSEMSSDDKALFKDINKGLDQSEEEVEEADEKSKEESKAKQFLNEALETVLDPVSTIEKDSIIIQNLTLRLVRLEKDNLPLEQFMEEMDKLTAESCAKSKQAVWTYVNDISNPVKKINMIQVTSQEDEIKGQYWNILKRKYSDSLLNNTKMQRKFRLIKERAINVKILLTKPEEDLDDMQMIWNRATVCEYNSTTCGYESQKSINDISSIFKTSNNPNELLYYWKEFRDVTGRKIRPLFKDYVMIMNDIAKTEGFNDAGETWRFMYEDDNFPATVEKLWTEVKPLYDDIHTYVRTKLNTFYGNKVNFSDENSIPAHILGNLWAQDWQAIYHILRPYPDHEERDQRNVKDVQLIDYVNEYYISLGFESLRDSYNHLDLTNQEVCLPSSHDMCDGVHYKIKWCLGDISDRRHKLLRIARILGHVHYFQSYRTLPILYRDGPTPAFQEALPDIISIQMMSRPDNIPEVTINNQLWLTLERLPLMAYGYALDKWRWDIFSNKSFENWNQHWWDLRQLETGISPPIPRNESDLDPASKYHILSRVQYITFLISNILSFQILSALCKGENNTGTVQPLHKCNIFFNKKVGYILRKGMSMGASEDWRSVLHAMTGETELSTDGLMEYFAPLRSFLQEENSKLVMEKDDIDASAPFVFGFIALLLILAIVVLYCFKKRNGNIKILSLCGLSKNGSLDIASSEMSVTAKPSIVVETIVEDKV